VNPALANMAVLAANYLAECERPHTTRKIPFPTYEQCTPKEFLDIFDELHESIKDPDMDHDARLMITADLSQLCRGAPFEYTIPEMCGVAMHGHPRKAKLLGLYKTLVHSIVEQDFELADETKQEIIQALRLAYHKGSYKRKVTKNKFRLPKQIAQDICKNNEALQYLELRDNCIIMRPKTEQEHKEDHYHERPEGVIVEDPEKKITMVEIPQGMAKKAGITGRVEIRSLSDRIEIYAIE
jgi:hypothetical protein